MTSAVAIMGKLPAPGRVKTRLGAAIGHEAAAELYRAFLLDVFAIGDRAALLAAGEGLELGRVFSCALAPDQRLESASQLAPEGWRVIAQRGHELGDRIEATRCDAGAKTVVIIGSDAPGMPPERIVAALQRLARERCQAVLGPTRDGGYDLIALRGPCLELLADIPWSTPEVMAATRAAAARAGIVLAELDPGEDVDELADLERLLSSAAPALHTRNAASRLFGSKLSFVTDPAAL